MKHMIITAAASLCMAANCGAAGPGSMTDGRDGIVYRTVTIGTVEVMAENLRFAAPESFSFNDNPSNDAKYGRLYRWPMLMAGSERESAPGICPTGWHVPSLGEWLLVFNAFGGKSAAGLALAAGGTSGLDIGILGRFNKSAGGFFDLGKYGFYWTSTKGPRGPQVVIFRPGRRDVTVDKMVGGDAAYCRCFKD